MLGLEQAFAPRELLDEMADFDERRISVPPRIVQIAARRWSGPTW